MTRLARPAAAILIALAAPAAAAPADTLAAVTAAWARADGAAIGRQFAPDAEFVAVDGSTFDGSEQIAQVFTALLADRFAGTTLTAHVVRERMLAPGIAYLRGDFVVAKGSPLDCGRFYAVLARRGGGWRVATYHEIGVPCPAR